MRGVGSIVATREEGLAEWYVVIRILACRGAFRKPGVAPSCHKDKGGEPAYPPASPSWLGPGGTSTPRSMAFWEKRAPLWPSTGQSCSPSTAVGMASRHRCHGKGQRASHGTPVLAMGPDQPYDPFRPHGSTGMRLWREMRPNSRAFHE